MKQFLFLSIAGLFSFFAGAQTETIEGNGNVVSRDFPVSSFSALKASGAYELKLSQGNKESVTIEADENLMQYFDVRNEGDKLVVAMKNTKNKKWNIKSKMKVFVSFKKLRDLEISTVGATLSESELRFDDLSLKNTSVGNVDLKLTANKIEMTNSSVGNVKLSGRAQDAIVKNTGVGKLEAGNFLVQSMSIENTGVGHAVVNAEKNLKVKDSFLGKVQNKGAAPVRKTNKVRV